MKTVSTFAKITVRRLFDSEKVRQGDRVMKIGRKAVWSTLEATPNPPVKVSSFAAVLRVSLRPTE